MLESLFNKIVIATLLKQDSSTGISCEICAIFKNPLLHRTPSVVAFENVLSAGVFVDAV